MTMQELIERLEKATGPNYALDCDIAKLIGTWSVSARTPAYSASVDAALTLVGEDQEWTVGTSGDVPGLFTARVYVDLTFDRVHINKSECSLPALALCASALRARLALASDGEKQ